MLAGGIILSFWDLEKKKLLLCGVCFLPGLFTSFPFLFSHRDPRVRGGEVIQTHCRCCCEEEEEGGDPSFIRRQERKDEKETKRLEEAEGREVLSKFKKKKLKVSPVSAWKCPVLKEDLAFVVSSRVMLPRHLQVHAARRAPHTANTLMGGELLGGKEGEV